jgi:hypothetical protein
MPMEASASAALLVGSRASSAALLIRNMAADVASRESPASRVGASKREIAEAVVPASRPRSFIFAIASKVDFANAAMAVTLSAAPKASSAVFAMSAACEMSFIAPPTTRFTS